MRGDGEGGEEGSVRSWYFDVGHGRIVKYIYMQIWRLNQHIAFQAWSRSVPIQ